MKVADEEEVEKVRLRMTQELCRKAYLADKAKPFPIIYGIFYGCMH